MYAVLSDDAIVGTIRLSRVDPPGVCETGMWLGRSARGQGIAPAALALVVRRAQEAEAHTVRSRTTVRNLPAQATLRRAGATLTPAADAAHVDALIPASAGSVVS